MRKLATYIKECWETTIALRERRSALAGLIGALLAFPIVWALGGTLELTLDGLWWLALWATSSALITLFVISPFHVWSDQYAKITELQRPEDKPKIEIQFDSTDSRYFSKTHFGVDKNDECIFVSVIPIARPKGTYIRACRGFVDAVWQEGPNGEWLPTEMNNPQRLLWASEGSGDSEKSDLDSDKGRPLNIFFVRKEEPRIQPWIPKPLNKHKQVFAERTKPYRFDIRVRSYGESESAIMSLKVQLGEQWNDIKVEKIR